MVTQLGTAVAQVLPQNKSSAQKVWEEAANGVAGMDRRAFVELMNGLWSGMGRTAMPDQTTLRVWYLCLHDLTVGQFGRAIQRYLTERSAEFVNVQLIRELSGVQQEKEAAALLAWDQAFAAINRVGGYAVPEFDDPVISHVIMSLGGWVWFCDQQPKTLREFTRARFLKTYDALRSAGMREPARLICLIDQSGGRSKVVRIGSIIQRRIEING